MIESVCAQCGAAIPQGAGWVRSGRLLCGNCDYAHKSAGHARQVKQAVPHTPRPRVYYKAQYFNDRRGVGAWQDVQKVCETEIQALLIARAAAPRWATRVRAMRITDSSRAPLPEQVR